MQSAEYAGRRSECGRLAETHYTVYISRCLSSPHKWGLTLSDLCVYGQQQTMNHTVNVCPFIKFRGGQHSSGDDAIHWLSLSQLQLLPNEMKSDTLDIYCKRQRACCSAVWIGSTSALVASAVWTGSTSALVASAVWIGSTSALVASAVWTGCTVYW